MSANKILIKEIKKRNTDAFDKIYKEYHGLIFYVISRKVNDREVIKELVQDTFLKMWNNIESYRQNKNFRAWLTTIATNTALDYLRSLKVHYKLDDEAVGQLDSNLAINEFYIDAKSVLSEIEYDIVVLIVVYNLKRREVAEILERPISTITRIYGNAINKLKEYYDK